MASQADVNLWGRRIGVVELDDGERFARFEYEPAFAAADVEPAPLTMPVRRGEVYEFPQLAHETFGGLPGLLADSLPDRYGNALIDAWLAEQGRTPDSFDAIERLCYVGARGMGALEFEPATGPDDRARGDLDIAALVDLAGRALARHRGLAVSLTGDGRDGRALEAILARSPPRSRAGSSSPTRPA